ncbi:LysR family transcriptional regulator [Actinophytocola gossypii]|uniref:LysR family transcriptional regulator n=1 Tax=Actinophytocola gossypii TaxID=2812003 RepID=A0ABT2JJ43_9PSEU|nr:LysR family transcriptional regulator [Actinophytocola gossypii]MCT2587741.1 LysR family transcriptional regulator [Actinophytocola gossypii]
MESRELAYFVAVAEELNFGRAAERLGMAQPPLSRAIQQLERRLGVRLLTRTSRRVELTPAGEVLLAEGRTALTALAAAEERARRAADPKLVLALKPGGDAGLLEKILARCAAEEIAVEPRFCAIGEQEGLLRGGEADVALLHLPYDEPADLATEVLLVDREIVLMPSTHRLADRTELSRADLDGEEVFEWTDECPAVGGPIRDTGQVGTLVALGQFVAVMPESFAEYVPPNLAAVPLTDGNTSTVVLAWPAESRSRELARFVRVAAGVTAPAAT